MYNLSIKQIRNFFILTLKKYKKNIILTNIEILALKWIFKHPEYKKDLFSLNINFRYKYTENPFLHLSMHLAIEEQILINQPFGIKFLYQKFSKKKNCHNTSHEIMDCIEQLIWESYTFNINLNSLITIELIKKKFLTK